MKRIIDGQAYNTDTATAVARYEYVDEKEYDTEATLYVTRGGAFFIVHKWAVDDQWKYHFEAVSRGEVERLVERTDNLEIIDEEALAPPPEASEEVEPGATIYVRLPASLKKRVDEAAKAEGVSVNVFAMRCLERCAAPKISIDAMIA
jgi:predicted HicB family RNase H-like nuclease